ncbi:MAG: hypothetical protein AAB428_03655 [Patescibacteria group bacterium]
MLKYLMRFSFSLLFLVLFLGTANFAMAATPVIENSGFVPNNIWFSKTPSVVGEKVEIYTLVWNASKEDISGTVSFFDNDSVVGKEKFVLAGEGSSKVLSVPWTVGDGYHKIYAQITDSSGAPRGKSAVAVLLQYAKTSEKENFISVPASASVSASENGNLSQTATGYVDEKINFAKDYIEVNLPKPVTGTVKFVAGNIEDVRVGANSWTDQTIKKLQKDLKPGAISASSVGNTGKDDESTPSEDFGVERPFKYVALAVLSAGNFILDNGWVFYGAILFFAFFVLRFIKRKFFF